MLYGLVFGDSFIASSFGILWVALCAILEAFSASPGSSCVVLPRPLTSIHRPSPQVAPFVTIIVKIPIIQMLAIALGIFMVAIEFPLLQLKPFAIHRSIALRIVMLLFQMFLGMLFYQVFYLPTPSLFLPFIYPLSKGTNAAIWSFIATLGYIRSLVLEETVEEEKENRGEA